MGLSGMTAKAEESPGITVSGIGVVEAMPDTVELTATVEGNAELAGDAVEKYRGSKRRVIESLNGLKIKGIAIVGSGLSVNSGTPANPLAAFQAGQANQPKVADKVAVQERLTVTLSGINTMSADNLLQSVTRILDVAKDAGVSHRSGPEEHDRNSARRRETGDASHVQAEQYRFASATSLRGRPQTSAGQSRTFGTIGGGRTRRHRLHSRNRARFQGRQQRQWNGGLFCSDRRGVKQSTRIHFGRSCKTFRSP